ncbi:MAG: hypothetical protein AMXMBFR7_11760 [Planctomycetota bacterium]
MGAAPYPADCTHSILHPIIYRHGIHKTDAYLPRSITNALATRASRINSAHRRAKSPGALRHPS